MQNSEFQTSLDYIVRSYLKEKRKEGRTDGWTDKTKITILAGDGETSLKARCSPVPTSESTGLFQSHRQTAGWHCSSVQLGRQDCLFKDWCWLGRNKVFSKVFFPFFLAKNPKCYKLVLNSFKGKKVCASKYSNACNSVLNFAMFFWRTADSKMAIPGE